MSDARPCHCGNVTECPNCWLAANDPGHRAKWGITGPVPPPPPPKPPCRHLGVVVEFCHSCNSESRHVRQCFHEDNPTETCTLGIVSGTVWSCANCPEYAA